MSQKTFVESFFLNQSKKYMDCLQTAPDKETNEEEKKDMDCSQTDEEEKLDWKCSGLTTVKFFNKKKAKKQRKKEIKDTRFDVNILTMDYSNFTDLMDDERQEPKEYGIPEDVLDGITVKEIFNGQKKTKCTFCLNEIEKGEEIRRLPCFHIFHKKEIDKWLSTHSRCITCRASLLN